jgi:hypothetical protein
MDRQPPPLLHRYIFGLRRAQDEDGDEWKIADLAVFLMLRL